MVVLDLTSGGGSIPFEALRLGHRVITNELNPVAATILHATLDYPARFGLELFSEIQYWGRRLIGEAGSEHAGVYADDQRLPDAEKRRLISALGSKNQDLLDEFDGEQIQDYLYVRQVTCPHCSGDAPLFNTCWLSKEASDPWGVKVISDNGKVRFETYRIKQGRGPHGEDPNAATVYRGTGQCVHCKQAIDGDEIKRQVRAAARHPTPMDECPDGWRDRLYAVVAVRLEPKLDSDGLPQRFSSGARKGENKTRKIRYFRPPNQRDLDALAEAQRRLLAKWEEWDRAGLIPTEEIPPGHRRDQRDGLLRYGITHWLDMFTPRQLLGHVTLIETLNRLKPEMLSELGPERGRAVVTYLQFAIGKGIDYNSRWTRWEFTRGVVKGTFGEMIFTGSNSGAAWGLSQITDAYQGIAELASPMYQATDGEPPLTILNHTGVYMPEVSDQSVDLVCMDPPYYNNVQYAELSDFFYVWQRRTLRDLYPGVFNRRLTDKKAEAVANPHRDKTP